MKSKRRFPTRPASGPEQERILKDSEENYRRSFNNARDAVSIFSKDREILDVNAQMVKLSGYPKKKLLNMKITQLFPEAATPKSAERIKQLLAGKNLPEFETFLNTCSGAEKPVEIAVTVLKNCYGRGIVFQSNIRDISRRKKNEYALNQKISELNSFINNIPDMAWLKDTNSNFIAANRAFCDMVGLDHEYLINHTSAVCFGKDAAKQFRRQDMTVMREKKQMVIEEQILNAQKKPLWVEIIKSPIMDQSGIVTGTVGIGRDVSKQKKAREELEEYRRHLEHLIEKKSADLGTTQQSLEKAQSISHIGSWELDLPTRKVICSNEFFRIFRINKKTFDGRLETVIRNRIHPDEKDLLPDVLKKLMEADSLAPVEFRIRLPDGFTRFIRADSEPLPDASGAVTGIVGVAQDITERKQADDRIRAALEEKEVMLREIHHRSKNNMQVISSLLNLQARTADKKTMKVLKDSQNRIRSMALIHEKLYQSKDLGNVNIGDYVTTLIGDLFTSYGVESSRIECVIKIHDVFLDLNRSIPCGLIINELVSNSLEHAFAETETGQIGISMAYGTNGRIILEYKDTGKGLPGTIDVKNSKTLGLKLVNTLATSQLKGRVEMSGRAGTCIRIVFPH